MEAMMASSFGFQTVNMILLSILIGMYVSNMRRMKSNFTIGLLIFASVLLVKNVASVFLGVGYMEAMTEPFETYAFYVSMIETVALISLFWISWK